MDHGPDPHISVVFAERSDATYSTDNQHALPPERATGRKTKSTVYSMKLQIT
jgi:hypothetical protein